VNSNRKVWESKKAGGAEGRKVLLLGFKSGERNNIALI
jgi:hypothetical protein